MGVVEHFDYGNYRLSEGKTVPGRYEAMVWPGLAVGGIECEPGHALLSFSVSVKAVHPEDDAESVRMLSRLIQPLIHEGLENSLCVLGES